MSRKPTIVDIAKALGVSTATVHRALHNGPDVTAATRNRVLMMAKKIGYKPNLAARSLASKRTLRISVNTLSGTTSFWDELRAGIEYEKNLLDIENVTLEFRTYSKLGGDELSAFEAALEAGVDGIIAFPSNAEKLMSLMRQAGRSKTAVVFVSTDAPGTGRLAVVSIDTMASGSLAADLMGRLIGGKGSVAVTLFDSSITEHAQKYDAFRSTMQKLHRNVVVHTPIEDHGDDTLAYNNCVALIREKRDLTGIYVSTEESMPVIRALRDHGLAGRITVITTDLFPALAESIRKGEVAATIHQRPRTQGRMAFRVLHDFLVEGGCPSQQTTFAPHLVMHGNLDFFQQRVSIESAPSSEPALEFTD
jgi:LacI family transcriptional regulator